MSIRFYLWLIGFILDMVKEILKYPNPILFKKSVDMIESDVSLLVDLLDTYRVTSCLGIALPQIGYNKRAFIINAKSLGIGDSHMFILNPIIKSLNDILIEESEGCLSLPNINFTFKRSHHILVEYKNENFLENVIELKGYAAVAFQHENDHLNGELLINKVSDSQKRKALKILRK